MARFWLIFSALTLGLSLFGIGCEGSVSGSAGVDGGSGCGNPSGVCADAGPDSAVFDFDAGGLRIERLAVNPAVAVLQSTATIPLPAQQFTAALILEDGSSVVPSSVSWSLIGDRIGTIDSDAGLFTASGVAGGRATATATVVVNGVQFTAPAAVVVEFERTILADGFQPTDTSKFDGTGVTGHPQSPSIMYPPSGAVMPQNVAPADIQWNIGGAGDLFRVQLEKPNTTITAYLPYDVQRHWLVDEAAWRAIANSDGQTPAYVTVERWVAGSGNLFRSLPVEVVFANAALAGSQYYWNLGGTRLRRVDDGEAVSRDFMPNPPHGCAGCHAISRSGRYIAMDLGHIVGGVFDLTKDLSGPAPPTEYPISAGAPFWYVSSWSPDDTRLVVGRDITSASPYLSFLDPFTGNPVSVDGALPPSATQPEWAPDNSAIAYVSNLLVDTASSNLWRGDISLLPITGRDAVGAPVRLHEGASLAGNPAGQVDSYPTWTPDAQRIAFGHGNGTFSSRSAGALYIMDRDGSNLVRLDAANGSSVRNYRPHFSPYNQGGYFWLSFMSTRPYGNPATGNSGGIQQLWVAAIRNDAPPGEDPSAVAYWLPGQNAKSSNISVAWAPQACRATGQECSRDGECCTEQCSADSVCVPPPEEMCRERAETCSGNGDCCDALICVARACTEQLI